MFLCNMWGAAKYYVFVVDNENDLIIKNIFFLLQTIVPLMECLARAPALSHAACFLCLKSKAQTTEPCGNFK